MTDIKKASEVFERTKGGKGGNLAQLQSQVGNALVDTINHLDAEQKKAAVAISITKVQQLSVQKDKSFLIIFITYRSGKVLLTPLYKKLVTELEKRLKKTVLILSTRKIQSRWIKQNRTQQRSNSRTLTAVYASVLDELLLPGIIIGFRTRVRLDGSSFSRVVLDKNEQHFLEDRVEAIKTTYKKITNRDIEIEFQKESAYYTLKKGEKK